MSLFVRTTKRKMNPKEIMMSLMFAGDKPLESGLYLVYTKAGFADFTDKDVLMWHDGRWSYPGSDQFFRGDVLGYMGPLPHLRESFFKDHIFNT